MENNEPQKNTKIDAILDRIKNNELTVRPKVYYKIKLAALIIISVVAVVISVFLCSFILFGLRMSGESSLIGFGPSGFTVFFLLFPWKLLFVDIIVLLILGWLLRSFKFGYRTPVLSLFLAVLVAIIVGGYALDRGTPIHDRLLRQEENGGLPFFGTEYEHIRRSPAPPRGYGVFRGTVSAIDATASTTVLTVEIEDPRTSTTTTYKVDVFTNDAVKTIKTTDRIFILGDVVNGEIQARGIRITPPAQPSQNEIN